MKFQAKADAIDLAAKKSKSEKVQIGGWSLMLLLSFLFLSVDGGVRSLAKDFDTSPDTVRNWLYILIAIWAVFIVASIGLAIHYSTELKRLEKSYIQLNEDSVSGVHFSSKEDTIGTTFTVAYKDITNARYYNTNGVTVEIVTNQTTYSCYQIQNAEQVSNLINERIKKANIKNADKKYSQTTNDSDTVFCMKCGCKLPQGSDFCPKCGYEIQ
ncbi:MAG: zinc ribbon domain-containing protein [Clostridia bacterium]|nr:zinc ribbon domain-containing protein [Clostridia bacterium]